MHGFYSGDPAKDIPQKENSWTGSDIPRWTSKEYNQLYDQAIMELDPKKNDALWIKMNDLVVSQAVSLPIIDRKIVSARAKTLDVGPNLTPLTAKPGTSRSGGVWVNSQTAILTTSAPRSQGSPPVLDSSGQYHSP
jgi:ABC-type transport system substrate-binding protein